MSIHEFKRPYNRTIVTMPGVGILCVCRARAGYRIWSRGSNGTGAFYRCPACASNYPNDKYEHEALPHVRENFEACVYGSYREQRQRFPHIEPHRWESVSSLFKGRIEEFEARYQAELELQRAADEGRAAADRALGGRR